MQIKDLAQFPEIGGIRAPESKSSAGQTTGESSFSNVLKDSLEEVNRLQQKADAAITQLATGEKPNLQDTMIAMEQASLSFQMMMQVRNKIVEAYQEIIRTSV
jgi:flagellar hook-basal body complex protein FliE